MERGSSGRGVARLKKPGQQRATEERQTSYSIFENWKNYSEKDKQIAKQAEADFKRPVYHMEARKW